LKAPLAQDVKARIIDTIADADASSTMVASDEPHLVALVLKIGTIIPQGKK
jgi:hypothetical protein